MESSEESWAVTAEAELRRHVQDRTREAERLRRKVGRLQSQVKRLKKAIENLEADLAKFKTRQFPATVGSRVTKAEREALTG